jgi:hypothetical protein
MVFDPLVPAIQNAIRAKAEGVYARIGKLNTDGTFTLPVPNRTNFIYVRLNGETQNVQEALNLKTQSRPDMPVRVRRNEAGTWEVIDVYPQETSAALGNAAPAMNRPPSNGEGVQETVSGRSFKPGRVKLSGTDNLTVRVEAFDYWYRGARVAYTGGTLDLASNRPSTSGQYAWVQIYVDPATNALAATTGTEYALKSLLTAAERASIDIGDGIPVDAVILRNAQTTAPVETDFALSRVLLSGRSHNYSDDNVTTPTDAELDTAFGTPATVGAGFVGVLDDAGAGANVWLVASDGTNWWYVAMTQAT